MDIPWQDVELFLAVAESGSLSAAARQLRVGQATVSRRIAQLEAQTGQALFHRGVEGAQLTAAGQRIVPVALRMAESAGELARLLEEGEVAPQGTVRIAASPGVGADFLVPFALDLRQRLPNIRLEVLASIRHVDLVRHEADIALRNRPPTQRELVQVAMLTLPVRPYAHRDYVATLPASPTMADIDWITWAPPYDQLPPRPQLEAGIKNFRPAFTSDDFLVQWRAAEAGLGAIFLAGTEHRYSRPTTLIPVPFELPVESSTYLVMAKTMLRVPRVRAVLDLVLAEFRLVKDAKLQVSLPE